MAGEILGLELTDPNSLGRIAKAMVRAVNGSFAEDKKTVRTGDEEKRRARICIELVRMLRGDLKWSIPRICDALPRGLRAKLDGLPWNPENERAIWTPPTDIVTL